MKAADLIALLKDARGALHGANHKLVERVDAAVAELEKAQVAAKPVPAPAAPAKPILRTTVHQPGPE